MKKRAIRIVSGVAVLVAFLSSPLFGNEAVLSLAGKTAPLFRAVGSDGNPVVLERLLDKKGPVLLNFWGLRCGSCIQEIPHLNDLFRRYEGAGLTILGVNVDGLPGAKIREQVERMGIEMLYPWIADPDFKLIELYHMSGAPLNVIIGSSGEVRYYHEGFEEGDEAALEREIKRAMPVAHEAK